MAAVELHPAPRCRECGGTGIQRPHTHTPRCLDPVRRLAECDVDDLRRVLNPDPLIPDGPEYDEPVSAGPGVMPWLWLVAVVASVVVAVAVWLVTR